MFEWLKSFRKPKIESVDSLPAKALGSQKALDTEQQSYLLPTFGLLHPFNLTEYLRLYVEDSLSFALVQANTNLTVSPFLFESDDDDVNEWMQEFHHRLDMDRVIWEICRDVALFGFAMFEIIGNGTSLDASDRIVAIRRLDPRYMFIQKNRFGRIERFIQRPLTTAYSQQFNGVFGQNFEPESIIYIHSLSPLSSYGQSILQALKARLELRNSLFDSTITAHEKFANAIDWFIYKAHPEREEIKDEIERQLEAFDAMISDLESNKSRYAYSGGLGDFEHRRVGAESLPDASKILEQLTADIVTSAGFHPSAFGIGDSEADIEASRFTVNNILVWQSNVISQLHAKLYSILPFIESECPADSGDDIKVRMEPPTEQTMKEGLEAETIRINNVILKVQRGIITPQKGAMELGYDDWDDEEKMQDQSAVIPNENDPNAQQQVRAGIKSLNKGKSPSNNPSGRKGNK